MKELGKYWLSSSNWVHVRAIISLSAERSEVAFCCFADTVQRHSYLIATTCSNNQPIALY